MTEKATIEVFKIKQEGHPYPWMFRVEYKGVVHHFGGIQNKCETWRSAYMKAKWRAKWLEEGVFDEKYK